MDEDRLFNNDPVYMKSLIGKEVSLEITDNKYTGIIFLIDPAFKTVILHNKSAGEYILTPYNNIKKMTVLNNTADEQYLIQEVLRTEKPEKLSKRKLLVKKWLEKMQIGVEESGDCLKIDDHLIIVPPYGNDNYICNNTIILDRIRNIIQSMPNDFS